MNRKKRTDVDFSKHELKIVEKEDLKVHNLKLPDTIMNSVKFINTNGILAVTGDFGNWIFCREFHPSKEGHVSDNYWIEKLRIASSQDPYIFETKIAQEEIKQLLVEHELSEKEKEWLGELHDAAEEGEYGYIAKAMDYPRTFEAEMIPRGKEVKFWLKVVFDAFEEVCERLDISKLGI